MSAPKNIKRESVKVAMLDNTNTVENNFRRPSWLFLYSDTYFTTPLKTPKEETLIKILEIFRI